MADIVTAAKRRQMMAGVRNQNTAPEMRVRKFLHRAGLRFRLHDSNLAGKPDLVLPKYRSVVFVHGCFWHQHSGCPKSRLPATNAEFWRQKLCGNAQRDIVVYSALADLGWRVFVIWECELRTDARLNEMVREIKQLVHP